MIAAACFHESVNNETIYWSITKRFFPYLQDFSDKCGPYLKGNMFDRGRRYVLGTNVNIAALDILSCGLIQLPKAAP
jgi:hypothetical protein